MSDFSFGWQGGIQSEANGAMSPPPFDIYASLIVKDGRNGFCDKPQLLFKKNQRGSKEKKSSE